MKKLLLFSVCVWVFAFQPVKAQGGEPDIVVVKVLDSRLYTRIIIARSWGIPDEVEINAGFTGNEVTVAKESARKMQEVMAKLYKEGYLVKSTFSGEQGLTTLVLVKE